MPETIESITGNPYLALAIGVGGVMGVLSFNALFCIWLERKVSAWIQLRQGPMEVGFHGTFQTLADIIFRSFAQAGLTAGGGTFSADDLLRPGRLAGEAWEAGGDLLSLSRDLPAEAWSVLQQRRLHRAALVRCERAARRKAAALG